MAAPMIGLQVAGTLLQAQGQRQQGQATLAGKMYEAQQLRTNANNTMASGQAEARSAEYNTSLAISRARAVAAANGGTATDQSVINIMGQLAARGKYNADVSRFNATTRSDAMLNQANADIYQGQQAAEAGKRMSISTVMSGLSGAGMMYNKYGSDLPSVNNSGANDTMAYLQNNVGIA